MTSQPPIDAGVHLLRFQEYPVIALASLAVYEYMITLDQELRCIWRRKLTGATVLFVVNRYLNIAYALVTLLSGNTNQPDLYNSCYTLGAFSAGLVIGLLLVLASFASLRAYAFCGRSLSWALPILLLNVVPIGVDIYYFSLTFPQTATEICSVDLFVSPEIPVMVHESGNRFQAVQACAVAADTLLIILTWVKTYRISREAMQLRMGVSISILLIRYGTLEFLVLICLDIISATRIAPSYAPSFTTFLSSIIMSRFMLNLQDVGSPSSLNTAQLSGLEFAISSHSSRIIGNLGQPLAHFVEPEANVDDTSGYVLHCRIPSSPRLSSVIEHFEELC